MSRVWMDGEPGEGEGRKRVEYECLTCHRKVKTFINGNLPIHRHKGERGRCKASKESVFKHKRL